MTKINQANDHNLRKQISEALTAIEADVTAMEDSAGYAMSVGSGVAAALTDADTYYFAALQSFPLGKGYAAVALRIPRAGTITVAQITGFESGAIGSDESWTLSIRVNDATDYTIAAVTSDVSGVRVWSNTAMSVPVARGDLIAIKCVTPTWATNPTDVYFGGHVFVK